MRDVPSGRAMASMEGPRTGDSCTANPDTVAAASEHIEKRLFDLEARIAKARDAVFGPSPEPKNTGTDVASGLMYVTQRNLARANTIHMALNELFSSLGI